MKECDHILVVDDEETQRELLTAVLHAAGHRVEAVTNGSDALKSVQRCKPPLILLDIGLPDIDGLEVMAKIKKDPATTDATIILISGMADTETIAAGLQHGAADFVPKPVNGTVLTVKVNNQLRLRESLIQITRLNEELEKEKRRIQNERDLLARYFSADLIGAILSGAISTEIGGEVRTASILFCDIRNSTGIAERIPPQDFVDLVNSVFTDVTDIIYGEGGSVNKFVGDGILATFGCPTALEDDAYHCARVAIKIRKYLQNFNQFRPKYLEEPIALSVGMSRGRSLPVMSRWPMTCCPLAMSNIRHSATSVPPWSVTYAYTRNSILVARQPSKSIWVGSAVNPWKVGGYCCRGATRNSPVKARS